MHQSGLAGSCLILGCETSLGVSNDIFKELADRKSLNQLYGQDECEINAIICLVDSFVLIVLWSFIVCYYPYCAMLVTIVITFLKPTTVFCFSHHDYYFQQQ